MILERFKLSRPFGLIFLSSTVIILLIIAITTQIFLGPQKIVEQKAQLSKLPTTEGKTFQPKEQEVEVSSTTMLVKLDPKVAQQVRKKISGNKTGLISLDQLADKLEIVSIEPAVATTPTSDFSQPIFSWFKITLRGKEEILKFKPELKPAQLPPLGENATTQEAEALAKLREAFASYQTNESVKEVEFDQVVHTITIPNDTYADPNQDGTWSTGAWWQSYEDLWGLKKIEADKAWDIATGSAQVVVAVVDTGVDYNHPDIAANIWTNTDEIPGNGIDDDNNGYVDDTRGWDFKNKDNDPIDDMGHGTHVAGTIGAVGGNGIGIVGVNWNVKIMPVKFLNSRGGGYISDAAQAIIYAADDGARVINNSWGSPFRITSNPIIEAAIDHAHSLGSVIVFAAGNSNDDVNQYSPENYSKTIAVGASTYNDQKANFSNWGAKIDVVAPGGDSTLEGDTNRTYENVLSLRASGTDMYAYGDGKNIVGGNYYRARGTSMAAPHVSGLAALILSVHPEFTNEEVRAVIKQSADDIGDVGWDVNTGAGRINAFKALQIENPLIAQIAEPSEAVTFFHADQTVNILGTAQGGGFGSYKVEVGSGQEPIEWQILNTSSTPVTNGLLATWDTSHLFGNYQIKLTVATTDGNEVTDRRETILGFEKGWPIQQPFEAWLRVDQSINAADLDQDNNLELVLTTYQNVFAWHADATPLDSWPISPLGTADYRGSSLGDLDNDGDLEIVFSQLAASGKEIRIFHHTGKEVTAGWPKSVDEDEMKNRSPILGDLDNDGELEIITSGMNKIYAWNFDGTNVPSWPVDLNSSGPNMTLPISLYGPASGIAVGNVDNDGKNEVVIAFMFWAKDIFVFSANGSIKSHWEANVDQAGGSTSPVLVDLDKDGDLEVLVSGYNKIFIWHHDGNTFGNNWPRMTQEFPVEPLSQVTVGDINNDGILEIVAIEGNTIYAWDPDGNPISPNWPITFSNVTFTFFGVETQGPAIGDIDGDGNQEIVVVGKDIASHGLVFALHPDGTVVEKFPIRFKGNIYPTGTPVLADLDNDGDIELTFYLEDGSWFVSPRTIVVLDLPSIYKTSKVDWPMLQHDPQRTSCYKCKSTLGPSSRFPPCYFTDSGGSQRSYGDVDGDGVISYESDAIMVAKIAFGMITPTPDQKKAADVDGNGVVNYTGDAMLVAQYALGVISNFPVCLISTPTPTSAPTPPAAVVPGCYDFDGDRVVSERDLAQIRSHQGETSASPAWDPKFDLNRDGVIDQTDILAVEKQIGRACLDIR